MIKKNIFTPIMLIILDGFGYNPNPQGNATAHAKMPFWNWLLKNYPHTLLHATGQYVGLIPGYMGNSEVGHLTIGAGRIIKSVLKIFHNAIRNGSFFKNRILIKKFTKLKNSNHALHLIGLLSDGGVHSHEYHLQALLKLATKIGLKKIFIHAFLDGRDVSAQSATTYLKKLDNLCKKLGHSKIVSICGRFYAMDRDKNWSRTKKCYNMLVGKTKFNKTQNWRDVLQKQYSNGITDEFILPTLLDPNGAIKPGDGVVFFNFRPDRARQLTECFINPNFNKFPIQNLCSTTHTLAFFITTTLYKDEFEKFNNDILFKVEKIKNTMLDLFAQQPKPLKVFIIAETEKYAHVTYFFRGMKENRTPNETRVLIPSIKTKNYIRNPEMSANKITSTVLNSLKSNPSDFYLINYANADMVGHSGNFQATVKACQCLDKQLRLLYKQVIEKMNGTMFITADHGNAEEKIEPSTGKPLSAHTKNPVPFVFVNKSVQHKITTLWPHKIKFGISNIMPTILKFLGIKLPQEIKTKVIKIT